MVQAAPGYWLASQAVAEAMPLSEITNQAMMALTVEAMALPIPAIPHASHPLFHFQIVREREADKVHGCFRNEIIGPGSQSPKHRRDDGGDEKRKAAWNDGFVAHWWSSFASGRPRDAQRVLYGRF